MPLWQIWYLIVLTTCLQIVRGILDAGLSHSNQRTGLCGERSEKTRTNGSVMRNLCYGSPWAA
jgi:hypothetical protein